MNESFYKFHAKLTLPSGLEIIGNNPYAGDGYHLTFGADKTVTLPQISVKVGPGIKNLASFIITAGFSNGGALNKYASAYLTVVDATLNAPSMIRTKQVFDIFGTAPSGSVVAIKDQDGNVLKTTNVLNRYFQVQLSFDTEGEYSLQAVSVKGDNTYESAAVYVKVMDEAPPAITNIEITGGYLGSKPGINPAYGFPTFSTWVLMRNYDPYKGMYRGIYSITGSFGVNDLDEEGRYGWMTPQGEYRVIAEANGYASAIANHADGSYTADNSFIPVPPEQTEVNIALLSSAIIPSGGGGGAGSYTITFASNGGSAVAKQTVTAGAKAIKPGDPAKEGFSFAGWFGDLDLTAEYNFDTAVNNSFTLYAKWVTAEVINPFSDINPSQWFYEHIIYVYSLGLMNGTGDTLFSPNLPLTRGMVVTVLHRMEAEKEVEAPASFSDVKDGMYYTEAVAWGQANNIVNGYPDGTFKPEQTVTRQELATILLRYANLIGKVPDDGFEAGLDFVDATKIGAWAKEGVAFCAANGIVEGRPQKVFDPTANATRAEFATMLHRF